MKNINNISKLEKWVNKEISLGLVSVNFKNWEYSDLYKEILRLPADELAKSLLWYLNTCKLPGALNSNLCYKSNE